MSDSNVSNEKSRTITSAGPLPRYRRAGDEGPGLALPNLLLQERDLALLRDVGRYGLMTTSQIELLRSCDARPDCRFVSRLTLTRRLKLLFHHGYLHRVSRPCTRGSVEPVYLLDREGARALRRSSGWVEEEKSVSARAPSQLPKPAALDHLLGIVGFRVALHVACHRSGEVELLRWYATEEVRFQALLQRRAERARMVTLKPDGCFVLRTGGQRLFYFLEVDRGGEPGAVLAAKCATYVSYWRGGGFARDFSVPIQVGFRVLFVVPSAGRGGTLLRSVRAMEAGRSLVWVTEAENVMPERILEAEFQGVEGAQKLSLAGVTTALYQVK